MKHWWGRPTRREWLLYFLIMFCGFLLFLLWGLAVGLIVILLYRKFLKKEDITKEHWMGTKRELTAALIILFIAFVAMVYFTFFYLR